MFQLDLKSSKSVYEQVIDNIKELVMTGVLEEGSRLPSVRDLSRQLTINPNTVQKAFRELERDGYIYTVTGRGSFVASRADIAVDESRVADILSDVTGNFKALIFLGIPPGKARELIDAELDKETAKLQL